MAKLGEIATYINGYPFKPEDWSDEGVPIIRIQDLSGNSYQTNRYNGKYAPKYEVNNGDVLISWSASLGVYIWHGEKAVLNQHIFKVVFDKAEVDKSFFVHQVGEILEKAATSAHGATMKHLTKPVFDALPFYLPPIEEQRHIAAVLDKVTDLIAQRRAQLDKLDLLVKSRFVEMFGDSHTNPYNLPTAKWNDVFNTTTGKLDSNAAVVNGAYPFFTCSKIALRIDKYAFDQEALLLAGNNAAGKYDVKYYKGKFNAYQRTYVLSLKQNWSYELFRFQLEDKLEYLEQQSLGGLTKYLTLKILNELEFVIPTKLEQDKFAASAKRVEYSKLTIHKSLDKLEMMKKALMQQYFK